MSLFTILGVGHLDRAPPGRSSQPHMLPSGCCVCVCEVIRPHSHGWHRTGCPQGPWRYLGHVSFIIQQASPGPCTWWQFLVPKSCKAGHMPGPNVQALLKPLLCHLCYCPINESRPKSQDHIWGVGRGVCEIDSASWEELQGRLAQG